MNLRTQIRRKIFSLKRQNKKFMPPSYIPTKLEIMLMKHKGLDLINCLSKPKGDSK